jgi:large repetitive protein
MDSATGIIIGTPAIATCDTISSLPEMNNWTAVAKEASGRVLQMVHFQIFVLEHPGQLEYRSLFAQYQTNQSAAPNYPLHATNRFVAFTIDPPLPQGLDIDDAGCITGTPARAQEPTRYVITAANPIGSSSTSIIIQVLDPVRAFRYPDGPILAAIGAPITPVNPVQSLSLAPPAAALAAPPSSGLFRAVPDLPAGLSVDRSTGAISGTAEEPAYQLVTCAIGRYVHSFRACRLPYAIECANGVSRAAADVTVAVTPALALEPTVTAVTFLLGRFATPLMLAGPGGPPAGVRYSVTPRLPRGLVLNRCTGTLAGVPREICADGSRFVVRAEREDGAVALAARVAIHIGVLAAPHGLAYRRPRCVYCAGRRELFADAADFFARVREEWSRRHRRTAVTVQRRMRRRWLGVHLAYLLRHWLVAVRTHRVEKLQVPYAGLHFDHLF